MTRGLLLFLALTALAASMLAGCVGPDAESAPLAAANATTGADPAGDDARGEAPGGNATPARAGSRAHAHDGWRGEREIRVYNGTELFFPFPVLPHGEGSTPASSAFVKLPPPNVVLEGTTRVRVHVERPLFMDVADPAPPGITMRYRTAADATWRDPVPVTPGEPVVLDVAPEDADLPHSTASLWAFEFLTDRPDVMWIDVHVTIVKGRDVPVRPGHPDAFANASSLVVLDEHVTSRRDGLAEFFLYGSETTWTHPARPIPVGTRALDVFVNVTRVTSTTGADAQGFTLEYHNATILDEEDRRTDRIRSESDGNGPHHYRVEPDPHGLDSPYATGSRWGFRVTALFEQVKIPGVGGGVVCGGCLAYEIEYDIKIVAHG